MLLLVAPSCGRIGFDASADARADALPTCSTSTPFETITSVDSLNTPVTDGGARLTRDETAIYFHTDRNQSATFAVWGAHRPTRFDAFSPPVPLLAAESYWPSVTDDELTVVYSDGLDLWSTSRSSTADAFAPGIAFVGTPQRDDTPMLGPLGTHIYFTHFEPEGAVYTATWPGGTDLRVLEESVGVDECPAVSADERVMYFGSDRSGDLEIWMEERTDASAAFGPPTRVAELGSPANENPTWLSADGCRLYFESDRTGDYNIYVAERSPQ